MTTPDSLLFRQLWDEFQEVRRAGTWAQDTSDKVGTLIHLVLRWRNTENPYFMDLAFQWATEWDAPLTATVRQEMMAANRARRNSKTGGTWEQVLREHYKSHAFVVMMNLKFHGASVSEAAEKAAAWADRASNGFLTLKASTLEKDYAAAFLRTGIEHEHHQAWREFGFEGSETWAAVRKQMPWLETNTRRGKRR